jgi:hypothetical protein
MTADHTGGKPQSKTPLTPSHTVVFLEPVPFFFRPTNQASVLMEAAMISPVEDGATPDASPERLKQSDLLSPRVQFSLKTPSPRKTHHPSSFITPENHNTPSPHEHLVQRRTLNPL